MKFSKVTLFAAGALLAVGTASMAQPHHGGISFEGWGERLKVIEKTSAEIDRDTDLLKAALGEHTHGEIRKLKKEADELGNAAEKFGKIAKHRPQPGKHLEHIKLMHESYAELNKQYGQFKDKFEDVFRDLERHNIDGRFADKLELLYLDVVKSKAKLALHMPHSKWGEK